MLWPRFQQQVLAHGGQARPFIQADWIQRTGVTCPQGTCVPLTCVWLGCQPRGLDFIANAYTPNLVMIVQQIAHAYNVRGGTWDSDFPDGELSGYALALEVVFMVQHDNNFSAEVRRHLQTLPPAYHYIGFLGYSSDPELPLITGHVFGIDSYRCTLFDPNAGEANFFGNKVALSNFTKAWLDNAYRITSPSLMLRRYVPAPAHPPAQNLAYRGP
jgi:hypothetical protein